MDGKSDVEQQGCSSRYVGSEAAATVGVCCRGGGSCLFASFMITVCCLGKENVLRAMNSVVNVYACFCVRMKERKRKESNKFTSST